VRCCVLPTVYIYGLHLVGNRFKLIEDILDRNRFPYARGTRDKQIGWSPVAEQGFYAVSNMRYLIFPVGQYWWQKLEVKRIFIPKYRLLMRHDILEQAHRLQEYLLIFNPSRYQMLSDKYHKIHHPCMGVNISGIIEPKYIELKQLSGKTIAVDAFNTIYQFLSIIRQRDGTPLMDSKGRTTSHLAGLFYRNINLLAENIKPCYVFDGEPPELKSDIKAERAARKQKARVKLVDARRRGDTAAALRYAQQTAVLNEEMIDESKRLLHALGIPFVQAPGEGEAQAAFMCKKGDVFATASQDFDALLFSSPKLVRNINITGKRKIPGRQEYRQINPELIDLNDVLASLGISQEQLIMLGILVGTDYNAKGIKGIGPKKGLKLIKEHKTMDVFKHVEWGFETSPEKIFELFKNPKTTDYSLNWHDIDTDSVKSILVDEHEFSDSRIDSAIEKVTGRDTSQKSLSSFT
jgi:flap endonuclease-1